METGRPQTDSVGRRVGTRWLTAKGAHASKSDVKAAIWPAAVIARAKPVIVVEVATVRALLPPVIAPLAEVANEQSQAIVLEVVAGIALAAATFNEARGTAIGSRSEEAAAATSTDAARARAAARAFRVSEVHAEEAHV